jgi:Rad3-related DNA helicase
MSHNEYVLFMQNDSNTYGYNQWFYFSLRNAKKNMKYTFKIANYVLAHPFRENPTHSSSWA